METREVLLYDTRKAPLFVRWPAALVGIFLLWISTHIISSYLLGFDFGLHFTRESGSPVLGFFAALGLGLFLLSVWFLRNRIVFDAGRNEILVRHSGLFGRSARRISLLNATGIYVRSGRAFSGRFWDISIEFNDGRETWLTRVYVDEDETAAKFSEATQLPVLKARLRR
jgi:hypothetical protein